MVTSISRMPSPLIPTIPSAVHSQIGVSVNCGTEKTAKSGMSDGFIERIKAYASKKEADPVSLAIERTKTYTTNRYIFMTSTPTLKTGHIWKAKEEADAEKHYFVPCPHCGQFIELKFAQVKWPGKDVVPEKRERAEMSSYLCQACGAVITDQHKGKMLEAGRWEYVRKSAKHPKSVAYWINTLYSPFTRFSEIAYAFLTSKDDPGLGRLYDQPKRDPRASPFHGRGGTGYEYRV